jgi:phage-related protein
MLGAGTIINPIIKIVTTVAILAAVYFFIVKPTLDTTNEAFNAFSDAFPEANDLSSGLQDTINNALDSTSDADRLRACLKRAIDAGGNEAAINRCVDRFG